MAAGCVFCVCEVRWCCKFCFFDMHELSYVPGKPAARVGGLVFKFGPKKFLVKGDGVGWWVVRKAQNSTWAVGPRGH